ncbi:hypothetical protein [Yoonia sp. SS1-5]|uniref:Uncharacterized protein n=1 Tax=Yoonia rhodophyticola TaxID=3137370 RepID=A0AAN0MEF6_9RHOB
MAEILVPLQPVELVERLQHQRVVLAFLDEPLARAAQAARVEVLQRIADRILPDDPAQMTLWDALFDVLTELHTLEHEIRSFEQQGDFGTAYVALTQSYMAARATRAQLRIDIAAGLALIVGSDDH